MNPQQEKIFNDQLRGWGYDPRFCEIRVRRAEFVDLINRILAASTPALPGEVRLPMASEEAKKGGWTLDYKYLQRVCDGVTCFGEDETNVSMETAEGVILSAIRELNPTPQASTPPASTVEDEAQNYAEPWLELEWNCFCHIKAAYLAGASRRRVTKIQRWKHDANDNLVTDPDGEWVLYRDVRDECEGRKG